MTAITRMLKFGRTYSVKLVCGHQFRATVDEAERDQLCIGKGIECAECRAEQEL